ncbi:hypothetical protein Glove_13g73 [Diversispora epigaea]|uniref:Uncharacterized protein n=1 Tax=Diversispora epigaea TaxID=1348612 RepID=A0A397JM95_9GLOM|nr:hypothetical protein Glove_13g73 [Diversispora epigaea]
MFIELRTANQFRGDDPQLKDPEIWGSQNKSLPLNLDNTIKCSMTPNKSIISSILPPINNFQIIPTIITKEQVDKKEAYKLYFVVEIFVMANDLNDLKWLEDFGHLSFHWEIDPTAAT